MVLKDWVTVSISVLALGVSITTAYFNVFLERDDIRVIIGETPNVEMTRSQELSISGTQTLTFINLGNRAALINHVSALILPIKSKNDVKSCRSPKGEFPYGLVFELKPFVIKPGEIQLVSGAPRGMFDRKKTGPTVVPRKTYAPKQGDMFLGCLGLQIATPDLTDFWFRPVFTFTLVEDFIPAQEPLFNRNQPIRMLRRTSNTLWNLLTGSDSESIAVSSLVPDEPPESR